MNWFFLFLLCAGLFLIAYGLADKLGMFNARSRETDPRETEPRFSAYEALEQIEEEFDLSTKERRAALARIRAAIKKGRETVEIKIGGELIEVSLGNE